MSLRSTSKRGFLQHALFVDGRPQQFLKAGLQSLAVVLEYGAAMLLHGLARFRQMDHAIAQFADDAAAFFLAHLIQAIEGLADFCHDRRFNLAVGSFVGGVERAGNAQNGIEVGAAAMENSAAAARKAAMYPPMISRLRENVSLVERSRLSEIST